MISAIWKDLVSPYSSFGERCLSAVIMLVGLVAVAGLGWLLFFLIDSVGVSATKSAVVPIESRWVTPAYTTTTFVSTGKVMIPIVTYHPTRYNLRVQIDGELVKFTVDQSFFEQVGPGTLVQVGYGMTRLSSSYTVVTVGLAPVPYTSTLSP